MLNRQEIEWITSALDHGGVMDFDEFSDLLNQGRIVLFRDDYGIVACQVETHACGDVAVIWLAGGDLESLQKLEPKICEWAKELHCTKVMINGRRGWVKVLDDYHEHTVTLEKTL